jgi:hypothetical protein
MNVLFKKDIETFNYDVFETDTLYSILEKFNKASLAILDITKTRESLRREEEFEFFPSEEEGMEFFLSEEEEEGKEEEEEEEEIITPMPARIEDNYFVLTVTVRTAVRAGERQLRGNANIRTEFLEWFQFKLEENTIDQLVEQMEGKGLRGVKVYFVYKEGLSDENDPESATFKPTYYYSLKFFFDWLNPRIVIRPDTRKPAANMNFWFKLVDKDNKDIAFPGKKKIPGFLRAPRLEQYLVADIRYNGELKRGFSIKKRKEFANLRKKDEEFWIEQIIKFEKKEIRYPTPKYFRALETERKTIGQAPLEF